LKHITFFLDFISPYAYLAFERLPVALQGLSYHVTYKPVLFAAMLNHHGQLGPAEIAPKRTWTYRQMLWLAREHGVPMQAPASHPFNPLGLLRLAVACGRLATLTERLKPAKQPNDECVKAQLKINTDAAIASHVFGVPSMQVEQDIFWGADALPMLRQRLMDDPWFKNSVWINASGLPVGNTRKFI
jgi:2-hydroxychromene-2-carboxylate isomerase